MEKKLIKNDLSHSFPIVRVTVFITDSFSPRVSACLPACQCHAGILSLCLRRPSVARKLVASKSRVRRVRKGHTKEWAGLRDTSKEGWPPPGPGEEQVPEPPRRGGCRRGVVCMWDQALGLPLPGVVPSGGS